MRPLRVDCERPSQYLGPAVGVSTANEDQRSPAFDGAVHGPLHRERLTQDDIGTVSMAESMLGYIGIGHSLEAKQVRVPGASPDLFLPQAIESLDERLEPGFARSSEHGGNPESKAQAGHSSDAIAMAAALEHSVVIELGVRGQPELPPVGNRTGHDEASRDTSIGLPRSGQMAVDRHAVEHFDSPLVFDDKALNAVKAVDFRSLAGNQRKVPSAGWRWPTHASCVIDGAFACEDSADGSDGGQRVPLAPQFLLNGGRPVFTQNRSLERLAGAEDQPLDCRFGAIGRLGGTTGPVRQLGTVKPPSRCSEHPALHGSQRHPKVSSN